MAEQIKFLLASQKVEHDAVSAFVAAMETKKRLDAEYTVNRKAWEELRDGAFAPILAADKLVNDAKAEVSKGKRQPESVPEWQCSWDTIEGTVKVKEKNEKGEEVEVEKPKVVKKVWKDRAALLATTGDPELANVVSKLEATRAELLKAFNAAIEKGKFDVLKGLNEKIAEIQPIDGTESGTLPAARKALKEKGGNLEERYQALRRSWDVLIEPRKTADAAVETAYAALAAAHAAVNADLDKPA